MSSIAKPGTIVIPVIAQPNEIQGPIVNPPPGGGVGGGGGGQASQVEENLFVWSPMNESTPSSGGSQADYFRFTSVGRTTGFHLRPASAAAIRSSADGIKGYAADFIAANSECFLHTFTGEDSDYNTTDEQHGAFYGNRDVTHQVWVKPDSVASDQCILFFGAQSGTTAFMRLYLYGSGHGTYPQQLVFTVANSSGTEEEVAHSQTISAGTRYHVLIKQDVSKGKLRIQVNGSEESANLTITPAIRNTGQLQIGAAFNGTIRVDHFDGKINHYAVWHEALKKSLGSWLYNGGPGRAWYEIVSGLPFDSSNPPTLWYDASVNTGIYTTWQPTVAGDLILNGEGIARLNDRMCRAHLEGSGATAPIWESGVQNGLGAAHGDGTDWLKSPANGIDDPNEVTILATGKNDDDNEVGVLWSNTETTAARVVVYMDSRAISTGAVCGVSDGTTSEFLFLATNQDTAWRQITAVHNSKTLKGWIDGTSQGTATSSHTGAVGNDLSRLFAQNLEQTPLDGYIGECMVFESELSTSYREARESALSTKWATP